MSNIDKKQTLLATCSGEVIKLEDVCDEVFSSGVLGKGFAIIPSDNDFFSPINGKISNAYDTGHAYMITAEDGLELLVHIGINTVELDGEFFSPVVKAGMSVSQGDKLAYADASNILSRGYDPVCVVVITNPEKIEQFKITYGKIDAKSPVMEYTLK
ncbi:MAG: PTS glucose transporter subunit IIA [Ruminococcaceae bacterium]|nr:PTS glucose transporter subunit IIA [Oscillospiraceae bacterium]